MEIGRNWGLDSWQMVPTDAPQAYCDSLIRWFRDEGEDYPWRQTEDPYSILVSEIMLQQTQVATVLG